MTMNRNRNSKSINGNTILGARAKHQETNNYFY